MRSFSAIAAIATLAFSTFTSAAPILKSDVAAAIAADVPGVASVGVATGVAADIGADISNLLPRHDVAEVASLPEILSNVIDSVTPIVEELGALTEADATVDVITPLTTAIVEILNTAITQVNALVGQPLETILGTVEGTLDLANVAQLLGSLLTLVFTTLNTVLKITGAVAGGDLFVILSNVGEVLGQLIQVVLALVGSVAGGLLDLVLPLVGSILPVVTGLGLNTLGGVLGAVTGSGGVLGGVLGSVGGIVGGVL